SLLPLWDGCDDPCGSESAGKPDALQTLARCLMGRSRSGKSVTSEIAERLECAQLAAALGRLRRSVRLRKRRQAGRTPNAGALSDGPLAVGQVSHVGNRGAFGVRAACCRFGTVATIRAAPKAPASRTHSKRWRAV